MNKQDTTYKYRNNEYELMNMVWNNRLNEDLIVSEPGPFSNITSRIGPLIQFSKSYVSTPRHIDITIRSNWHGLYGQALRDASQVESARLVQNWTQPLRSNDNLLLSWITYNLTTIKKLELIYNYVLPVTTSSRHDMQYMCNGSTELEIFILRTNFPNTPFAMRTTNAFKNCTNLKTIVLDTQVLFNIPNNNMFDNSPFASGGTGGTIYIPKKFYDHLGDGSELDYKSATNWSVFDSYGTITWAQIEGSEYEIV